MDYKIFLQHNWGSIVFFILCVYVFCFSLLRAASRASGMVYYTVIEIKDGIITFRNEENGSLFYCSADTLFLSKNLWVGRKIILQDD